MSTDQLNLLNDTGFSSSASSQTVVPKSGTVMFVTFIPEKQFEQGWWTQNCTSNVAVGTINSNKLTAMVPLTAGGKAVSSQTASPSVDLESAERVCAYEATQKLNHPKKEKKIRRAGGEIVPETMHTQTNAQVPDGVIYATVPNKLYSKWSGNAVQIFQELSTTVVAGMHIIEDKQLQPTLTDVNCNRDAAGTIKLPASDSGTLTCKLKGSNIGKISLLRLRNDSDPAIAEGTVKQDSGDDTAGTVSFPVSNILALPKPDYKVYFVTATNPEKDATLTVHFPTVPYAGTVAPDTLDMNKPPTSITLSGYRLANVTSLTLTSSSGSASLEPAKSPAQTDKQVSFTVDKAALAKLGAGTDLKLSLVGAAGTTPTDVTAAMKFVAETAAAAPPAKPTSTKLAPTSQKKLKASAATPNVPKPSSTPSVHPPAH